MPKFDPEPWRPSLVQFCTTYLRDASAAEDVAQEVCLEASTRDQAPDHPRAWLFTVARNRCLNQLRTARRRPEDRRLGTGMDWAESAVGPLTRLVHQEDAGEVRRLLDSLSEAHREVLLLRYGQGLGREEIATIVGQPISVIKSRLYEGLARLRELSRTS